MASPKKPKTAGKKPARSDAEWWNPVRVAAFEALRRNESPAVPERTLRGWQQNPLWQTRLAQRDAKLETVSAAREVERTNLLEEACSLALRFWAEMLGDREQNPFVRTQAANSVWSLKMKLDEKAQARALNRVWDISFQATVWE